MARAVSPSGLIVGYSIAPTSFLDNASVCAYKGGACNGGWHDIDTTNGGSSGALGVNDSNLIVGYFIPKGSSSLHAFSCAYNPGPGTCTGGMTELSTLGGDGGTEAIAVNNLNEIVGSSYLKGNTDYHATEWTQGGNVYDMNNQIAANSGWNLTDAYAINDLGQVVGIGTYKGTPSAFFMNPTSPAGLMVSQVAITDSGFSAQVAKTSRTNSKAAMSRDSSSSTKVIQGGSVQWLNTGSKKHSVVDATGMNLYASKSLGIFGGFVQDFPAAGTYPYKDSINGSKLKGSVTVPVLTAPASGTASSTFQVYWSAANAPKGFTYQIQVRRPGSKSYVKWLTGQKGTETWFVPNKGKGVYSFRARLFDTKNGKSSGWSPGAPITVN